MKSFKNLLPLAVLAIGIQAVSVAATCALSATYNQFMALGATGCSLGNIELSNFTMVANANPAGNALTSTGINLSLNNSVPGQLGMTWNLGMSATGAGNFQDVYFTYVLQGMSGVTLNGDILTFNGSAVGGGSTGVSSIVCVSGTVATCPAGNTYQASVFNPPPILGDTMSFPASNKIWAAKDVVASGAVNGTGQISSLSNTYTYAQVPEPTPFILLGIGLMGIALLGKRNKRAS